MRLGTNFYLSEFTDSPTAYRLEIDNSPSQEVIDNLQKLVNNILQPIRQRFGAIHITSGYRSKLLNISIGGASKSHHIKGMAADIKCEFMPGVFKYVAECMEYTQIIWEFGDDNNPQWIHVSYDENDLRKDCLKAIKKNGKTHYIKINPKDILE